MAEYISFDWRMRAFVVLGWAFFRTKRLRNDPILCRVSPQFSWSLLLCRCCRRSLIVNVMSTWTNSTLFDRKTSTRTETETLFHVRSHWFVQLSADWRPDALFHLPGNLSAAHTHTRLTALFPGLPGWAGIRKVEPIRILLKQETVSGSDISWAVYKSAPRSRKITTPAPRHSVFYRPDALPAAQPTASKHWRQICQLHICNT